MTNRINSTFDALKKRGEKALVTYVAAGDPFPSIEKTAAVVLALADAGADIIELGIPYSDPQADGAVIQAATQRALEAGVNPPFIFDVVREVRKKSQVPIILMGYYNTVFRTGHARFAAAMADAGADGVILSDLPPEEAGDWKKEADARNISTIFLIAPTSTPERIQTIANSMKSGFIYCVSRTGVTGARSDIPSDLSNMIELIRAKSSLPIAVGFGISTADQARLIAAQCDGVVIGSKLVDFLAQNRENQNWESDLKDLVSTWAAATDGGHSPLSLAPQ